MRITFLKDKLITDEELNELERQFSDLFVENADIDPVYFSHIRDYSFYKTFKDKDGDIRPTNDFLIKETDFIKDKYGTLGTDHVVLLIHEDNWLSDPPGPNNGIWGTNYSNIYHGYQVHYARYDRDNMANALGTLYHETMHSFDTVILTELGVNIAQMIGVSNWDKDIIHGKHPSYSYIRYKENLDALTYIAPYLKKAYAQRKARFDKHVGLMKTVIQLLQTLVVLYRQQLNRKQIKLCSKHTQ